MAASIEEFSSILTYSGIVNSNGTISTYYVGHLLTGETLVISIADGGIFYNLVN